MIVRRLCICKAVLYGCRIRNRHNRFVDAKTVEPTLYADLTDAGIRIYPPDYYTIIAGILQGKFWERILRLSENIEAYR